MSIKYALIFVLGCLIETQILNEFQQKYLLQPGLQSVWRYQNKNYTERFMRVQIYDRSKVVVATVVVRSRMDAVAGFHRLNLPSLRAQPKG